ncbi:MAG: hypothetical protein IKS17_10005 [Firmicutes bacterium]|nr:hypothetical protein [Bacillota bacterium]
MKLNLKRRIVSAAAAVSIMVSAVLSPVNVYSQDECDLPQTAEIVQDAESADDTQLIEEYPDTPEDNDIPEDGESAPVLRETDIEAEITTTAVCSESDGDEDSARADGVSDSVITGGGSLTAFVENEYKITLAYDSDAGIPEGAQLRVAAVQRDDYVSAAADALDLAEDDYVLYTRFFDITILMDGTEIEPLSPVTVTAELLDMDGGAEALQVVHIDGDGAVPVESSVTDEAEVVFEAESFSVYGFSSVLHTVYTEQSDIADITLYSTGDSVDFAEESIFVEPPEEGIEPSKSFVLANTDAAEDTRLWVKAEQGSGELPKGQSCALYSVLDGNAGNVIIENIAESDGLVAVDSGSDGVVLMIDTGYRRLNFELEPKTGTAVTLDGLMPRNAQAKAVDAADKYGEYTIAACDITILDGKNEYQPCEEHPVSVTITDPAITPNEGLGLWHIKDNGEREQITDFTAENGKISFTAKGFSVYEIVQGPEPYEPDTLLRAATLDEIKPENGKDKGFYLSVGKGTNGGACYFRNVLNTKASNGAVFYITDSLDIQAGAVWYFEQVSADDNTYRVYTYPALTPETKNYILRKTDGTGNAVDLTTDPTLAVVFEMQGSGGLFYMKDSTGDKYLQYSNSGGGIRFYDGTGDDKNSKIALTYASVMNVPDDYYGFDGKTCALIHASTSNGITTGYGPTTTAAADATRLRAEDVVVKINGYDHTSELYVTLSGGDLAMFTFHTVGGDRYLLSTTIGEDTKYLKIEESALSFVDEDEASEITVVPGKGDYSGRIRLVYKGINLAYTNKTFYASANGGAWLWPALPSSYQDDDFVIYSAKKASVSNKNITTGSEIIVYTRIWNDAESRYDFYAVNHDGTLVPCYERGNSIMWIGSKINTLLWEFTEYTYADGTPNHYYEFYNPYSGKYLAPQMSSQEGGQVLSDNTIGVNLPGRKSDGYYTQITAWDDPYYAYASLKADGTEKLTSCHRFDNDTATFYFASMEPIASQDLTEIETVDNGEYGIKMRMVDFNGELVKIGSTTSTKKQNDVMGESTYTNGKVGRYGLLKTDMTAGYPTAKLTGKSLSELFNESEPVNHLFIESTHRASGYFEYDSCQNFATLIGGSGQPEYARDEDNNLLTDEDGENYYNFKVYKELGTIDTGVKDSYKHGQFMPYNTISPDVFSEKNPENLLDAEQNPLPETDPRKYEPLCKIASPDYYFGMELAAGFVQTPSGKDAWDHDIIFEFTGDDDFWLYVDGELVIDLGGIHSAIPGSVNFKTGEVNVNNCTGKSSEINRIYNTIYTQHNENATQQQLTDFRNMLYKPGGKNDPQPNTLTLKEIFAANFISRYFAEHPDASADEAYTQACAYIGGYFEADANGTYGCEDIFKDYSTHEMKIFYMERGAGASNLHMRFNLSDVKPGQVVLSKELEGSSDIDFSLVRYPYQIWYKPENSTSQENDGYILLGNVPASGGDQGEIYVTDPTSNAPVDFRSSYTVRDVTNGDITYENVYFLNPGKKMAITFPSELIGYYIVECGVNKDVYSSVYGNNVELAPTDTANVYYKDYAVSKMSVKERPSVNIKNVVDSSALRTLSIKKNLYSELVDENDVIYSGARDPVKDARADACLLSRDDDDTEFSFRLYLGDTESSIDSLPYANMHKYRVKDENGNYCKWVRGTGFVSTGKNDLSQFTDEEELSVTFETSMNGSISKIPAGFTVEVPGILVGTKFRVEERENELPKGYRLMQYERIDGTYLLTEGDTPNAGVIRANSSPKMTIKNRRGWGLTAQKFWSDDGYVGWHYPVYIAVYIKNGSTEELLPGTVREITKDSLSAYYYFDELESGHTFADYVVREVTLDDPHYDGSGALVYNGTPVKVDSGAFVNVDVQQVNLSDTNVYNYEYAVTYEQGTASGARGAKAIVNVRTDKVYNTRSGGIMIDLGAYKAVNAATNMVAQPLAGGKFKLTLYRTTDPEKTVYTQQASYDFVTGSDGIVTILYNFMRKTDAMDAYYLLEEIQSPAGYVGISHPVKFDVEKVNGVDVVTLYDDENGDWKAINARPDDDDVLIANLNIFNKPFNFRAIKFEAGNSANTLGSVVFALYRQVKGGNGAGVKDYRPISGYEHLETDAEGVIDKINQELELGTYYLTELSPLTGFENLLGDIIFTVTELGGVTLVSAPAGVELNEDMDESGMKTLDLSIPNRRNTVDAYITVHKTVAGNMGDKNKEFTFTFTVDGAAAGALFVWTKNGTAQTSIHSGETFTLKHGDTAVFTVTNGRTVTITETAEGYTTTFKKGSDAETDGSSISFTVAGDTTVEVTNTLNMAVPTDVAHHTAAFAILFMFAVLSIIIKIKENGIGR